MSTDNLTAVLYGIEDIRLVSKSETNRLLCRLNYGCNFFDLSGTTTHS